VFYVTILALQREIERSVRQVSTLREIEGVSPEYSCRILPLLHSPRFYLKAIDFLIVTVQAICLMFCPRQRALSNLD
jgi:hypothetical protein